MLGDSPCLEGSILSVCLSLSVCNKHNTNASDYDVVFVDDDDDDDYNNN